MIQAKQQQEMQKQQIMINDKEKDYPPKQTLYIRNLNEKIKSKDMKYALYILFSAYGEVRQIIAKKNNRMRGQAFVIFSEVNDAMAAKNNLDRYVIFDKPLVAMYLFREFNLPQKDPKFSVSTQRSDCLSLINQTSLLNSL